MLKSSARRAIRLRGVRHNNLKNLDLDLPLNQLIVITGLSGSGKSSLAFDTLFAEGQRRYIETFSPYARQFFDRMDKPQVDSIEGIPPAIAIEQRNAVKTTRSTVGTMTEICDYMKMLWPQVAQLHCRGCGQPVRREPPQRVWDSLRSSVTEAAKHNEVLLTFDLPLTEKLTLNECLALISKQGYQRLLVNGQIMRLEESSAHPAVLTLTEPKRSEAGSLTVVQDRLRLVGNNRSRFVEACEQAYHFGKGKLRIWDLEADASARHPRSFSKGLHCAQCDIEYREPSPALFSFNHPVGACPSCRGFGRVISIDYDLALPDRSKTIAQGLVKPWQTGHGLESQTDLLRTCRRFEIPTNVAFDKLPKKWQDFVINGEPGYGKDEAHEWPRAWYGIKGYFRWLESKAYKMHVRVLLSRYRAYTQCPSCLGARFQPEALLYRVAYAKNHLTLADFYQLPIRDAASFVEELAANHRSRPNDPLGLVLNEVRARLAYLAEVGLGYLTLDRPTRTLSGGETERVNLTTCLGTRLVNTLFVLDEPSVGLHPRDTERLVRILQQLRNAGNTVVVVEHEASVMRAADQILDLGPGHGATGGELVFQGSYAEILKGERSLTGQYLSGRKRVEIPQRRPVGANPSSGPSRFPEAPGNEFAALVLNDAPNPLVAESEKEEQSVTPLISGPDRRAGANYEAPATVHEWRTGAGWEPEEPRASGPILTLSHATRNNVKDLSVEIPLGRFVCITGVSGSGKTTLLREILLPALSERIKNGVSDPKIPDQLTSETDSNDDSNDTADLAAPVAQLEGADQIGRVILVDQSILGKTPRSNPAVYIGAFDDIREFFAQSSLAKQRGLNASAFSFNSGQGQCERCRGAGFEKIEMQFLSDVFIRCPDCNGRRYRSHILEVKVGRPDAKREKSATKRSKLADDKTKVQPSASSLSIADLLESTIEEAIEFLGAFPESRPARQAIKGLGLLQEVGLGYLKLGQPINTLSGGESQRLKLVRHLMEAVGIAGENVSASEPLPERGALEKPVHPVAPAVEDPISWKPSLFLFDEPTTGLHFDDVRVLLKVFQRLADGGHSVIVIEHNLEVIKCADWIIDLGPDAGDQGGQIVAEGTPEIVAACERSHTGQALRGVLCAN